MPVIFGAELLIVNPLVSVADWLSRLVTITFHWPVAALARLKLVAILPGFTTTTGVEFMISDDPVLFRRTVAPATKPVPDKSVMLTDPVFTPAFGVIDITVGAGCVIVNPFCNVPDCVSVLVTVTFQGPANFPVRSKRHNMRLGLSTMTLVPSISA